VKSKVYKYRNKFVFPILRRMRSESNITQIIKHLSPPPSKSELTKRCPIVSKSKPQKSERGRERVGEIERSAGRRGRVIVI
jgi:uncharacterized protein (UPF0333 family)